MVHTHPLEESIEGGSFHLGGALKEGEEGGPLFKPSSLAWSKKTPFFTIFARGFVFLFFLLDFFFILVEAFLYLSLKRTPILVN